LPIRRQLATMLLMKIGQALAPLVDLIYPPRCPSCGEGVSAQGGLCAACWDELEFPGDPACVRCLRPFRDEAPEDRVCEKCHADPPIHDGIAAGTIYTQASRRLVLSFKHGGKIALAPMLARMIAGRLPELEGEWLVVPVPLHRTRLWRRGFNQAALLAREIARLRGQKLLVDGLVRGKQTRKLGHLGRTARAEMLKGAVAVHRRHRDAVQGAQVILVDDVMTSGATTNACIEVLREAGAREVMIACFARTLD
jgi:ComF family protein